MKTLVLRSTAIALCATQLAACGSAPIKPEAYLPAAPPVALTGDQSVERLFDRWDETSDQNLLIDHKNVVASSQLTHILGNDSTDEVSERLRSASAWEQASQMSGAGAIILAAFGLVGMMGNAQMTSNLNAGSSWSCIGGAVLAGAFSYFSHTMSRRRTDEALQLHDTRLQKPTELATQGAVDTHEYVLHWRQPTHLLSLLWPPKERSAPATHDGITLILDRSRWVVQESALEDGSVWVHYAIQLKNSGTREIATDLPKARLEGAGGAVATLVRGADQVECDRLAPGSLCRIDVSFHLPPEMVLAAGGDQQPLALVVPVQGVADLRQEVWLWKN